MAKVTRLLIHTSWRNALAVTLLWLWWTSGRAKVGVGSGTSWLLVDGYMATWMVNSVCPVTQDREKFKECSQTFAVESVPVLKVSILKVLRFLTWFRRISSLPIWFKKKNYIYYTLNSAIEKVPAIEYKYSESAWLAKFHAHNKFLKSLKRDTA